MALKTIQNYNKRASSYEKKWKAYLDHTHQAFLQNIETSENDKILDISGGTGLLAQMLIERNVSFKHLIINDPSGPMLDIARRRLSDEQRIGFSNDRAERLNFEANQFTHIFCLNAFHFYTDQQRVLNRCYAMLRPGGRLYLLDWNRTGFFCMVNQLISWLASDYIDTRSLNEINQLLDKSEFETLNTKTWNWRYWKFFIIAAEKSV